MKLHTLKPATGSTKSKKRIGRGQGSGMGGTSTRGHNGAQSRSGYSRKEGFEGGQLPLQRRLPKFGFTNPFRVEYVGINLQKLEELAEKYNFSTITPKELIELGILSKKEKVKILGTGELKTKLSVEAHAFSKSAKSAIESLGATATQL
ncbi:MAG: large subunit ribosomal protein L15 [Bacteroidia bacterium]|jgi:large subunit ribosomal protein L15